MTLQEALQSAVRLHKAGQIREAEAIYQQVLKYEPKNADALHLLGVLAHQDRDYEKAIELISRAIAVAPNNVDFHCNLALAQEAVNQPSAALTSWRRALQLRPNEPKAIAGLASALLAAGDVHEAESLVSKLLPLNPQSPQLYLQAFNIKLAQGNYEQAIAAAREGVARFPQSAELHFAHGIALLTTGDFTAGWDEYEWRRRIPFPGLPIKEVPMPCWDGRDLSDQRILLHTEQGFGDALQFIRYLPEVTRRCRRVIVAAYSEVLPVFGNLQGVEELVSANDLWPEFDVHCPLMSLPRVLKTTLQNIPTPIPYLTPDPTRKRAWELRLTEFSNQRKIGLVWAGKKIHPNDRNRSMSLAAFAPLAAISGVEFFSLQKGPPSDQTKTCPFKVTDWTGELNDLADTAALLANLDLLITVDTAVAHLAGAMGKPVWVLLPFVPDWRWLLDREDSPWYPTMRLFRQPRAGDWDLPMIRIVEALKQL